MPFKDQCALVHTALSVTVIGMLARLSDVVDEDDDDIAVGAVVHELFSAAIGLAFARTPDDQDPYKRVKYHFEQELKSFQEKTVKH